MSDTLGLDTALDQLDTLHDTASIDLDVHTLAGLPSDRAARLAARRTFVDMKQLFMRAVADLSGPKGLWLQHQVRLANDPHDLWVLRGALLVALHRQDNSTSRQIRGEVYRGLDSGFADSLDPGNNTLLPPLTATGTWQSRTQSIAALRR
jgi:hypothetical protein